MTTVIKAENISKQYRLGYVGSGSIKDDVKRWWYGIRGKEDPLLTVGESNDRTQKGESDYVWALKDINFEIQQGDTVGIIGRNGAGKSTLLKLLSKVTAPTTGNIKVKGRIASLLEVGTGFHGELTGRENIYLNGAIMGMRKHEITRRLDEIVDFAGVERYLDTPVKRYSSGMYVRLGFAVAAHLQNEILIVDEVLAVGDSKFQKKCLGKMGDVSKNDGRTVLFVSHNMQAVSALTKKCIYVENGVIKYYSDTNDTIGYYSGNLINKLEYNDCKHDFLPKITNVRVITSTGGEIQSVGEKLKIEFILYTPSEIQFAVFSYQIINSIGFPVIHCLITAADISFCSEPGYYKITSEIPKSRLYPDSYSITINFDNKYTNEKLQIIENICAFQVVKIGELKEYYWGKGNAVYLEDNKWYVNKL